MKQIYLGGKYGSAIGNYALVDDADYDWLNQWRWCVAKGHNTLYAVRGIRVGCKKSLTMMHRQILGITDQNIYGDHEDGNGLNNQRYNLREATNQQNQRNSGAKNRRNYKGICWDKHRNKWATSISIHKTTIFLGRYDSEHDAALAYNEAAIKYFGEFARLNIIDRHQKHI